MKGENNKSRTCNLNIATRGFMKAWKAKEQHFIWSFMEGGSSSFSVLSHLQWWNSWWRLLLHTWRDDGYTKWHTVFLITLTSEALSSRYIGWIVERESRSHLLHVCRIISHSSAGTGTHWTITLLVYYCVFQYISALWEHELKKQIWSAALTRRSRAICSSWTDWCEHRKIQMSSGN